MAVRLCKILQNYCGNIMGVAGGGARRKSQSSRETNPTPPSTIPGNGKGKGKRTTRFFLIVFRRCKYSKPA